MGTVVAWIFELSFVSGQMASIRPSSYYSIANYESQEHFQSRDMVIHKGNTDVHWYSEASPSTSSAFRLYKRLA